MVTRCFEPIKSGMGGLTLIEVLVTILLIGLIVTLLIPNLTQVRQEATRQTIRHQAKVLETALANWYASQPNLNTASNTWNTNCTNSASPGYITNTSFSSGLLEQLVPYLDASAVGTSTNPNNNNNPNNFLVDSYGAISTSQMSQIVQNTGSFASYALPLGTSVTPQFQNETAAFMALYWDPANRTTTSPKVLLYLPEYK